MKLLKEPYEEIRAGRKTVEMRLYDEKRRGISAGDTVFFTCPEQGGQRTEAMVRGICIYEDFFALAKSYGPRELGFDGRSAEYIGDFMLGIYSEDAVKKYGVCAILLETRK